MQRTERAGRSLGQHFLVDRRVLGRIVEAAELSADDLVVEIGPGRGVLTRALASRAGRVVAVELDPGLADLLSAAFRDDPDVDVVEADARDVAIDSLVSPGTPYKVVANLPYYAASPIVRRFLEASHSPRLMVFMVQREVARSMTAAPGGMTLLSVMVQAVRRGAHRRVRSAAGVPSGPEGHLGHREGPGPAASGAGAGLDRPVHRPGEGRFQRAEEADTQLPEAGPRRVRRVRRGDAGTGRHRPHAQAPDAVHPRVGQALRVARLGGHGLVLLQPGYDGRRETRGTGGRAPFSIFPQWGKRSRRSPHGPYMSDSRGHGARGRPDCRYILTA